MTSQRRRTPTTRRISDQWLQYVRGTAVESAANTFTEVTVALPVVVAEGFVIEAHLVEFFLPSIRAADLKATDDVLTMSCQLTKSSQSAIIRLDDPDYIYGFQGDFYSIDIQTAEVVPAIRIMRQGAINWQFPEPILLPFSQIFFGVDTGGGSVAERYSFRIGYKTIRLTTRQLPELIQAVS